MPARAGLRSTRMSAQNTRFLRRIEVNAVPAEQPTVRAVKKCRCHRKLFRLPPPVAFSRFLWVIGRDSAQQKPFVRPFSSGGWWHRRFAKSGYGPKPVLWGFSGLLVAGYRPAYPGYVLPLIAITHVHGWQGCGCLEPLAITTGINESSALKN